MAACGEEEPHGRCYDCQVHPEAEACGEWSVLCYCGDTSSPVTCCDTVTLSSTDLTYLASAYKIMMGTYVRYTTTPTSNDRNVYQQQDNPQYCLSYAFSAWRVSDCTDVGTRSYYLASSGTAKKCPHGGSLSWQWDIYPDSTMTVSCSSCKYSSPSLPH